jgi:hypothetical protein
MQQELVGVVFDRKFAAVSGSAVNFVLKNNALFINVNHRYFIYKVDEIKDVFI